eukprot:TRINITY_DN6104_c0_g1_i1.p1 TRINITY_DN6104_c0_g1~~TRINITY_DN6104_c0_g1_i1.p1  ORF type:complete len:376 (+),score=73.44 TRINITY_DN6104_c0_g1_i1:53-1180(+)
MINEQENVGGDSLWDRHPEVADGAGQGYFSIITRDLLMEILQFVDSDLTFARASSVSHRWYSITQVAWKGFVDRRGFTEDEMFWKDYSRDWKWLCHCRTRIFAPGVIKNGLGTFSIDSTTFEGEWKNDLKEGYGRLVHEGVIYKGIWSADKRSGFGIMYYKNYRYEGEWLEDLKHGKGTFYFENGDVYSGQWAHNKKLGHGVYKFGKGKWEGDRYEGDWVDDEKNGKGIYLWKNGDTYIGEFLRDNFHGEGTLCKSSGSKYVGMWKDDKKSGQGTWIYGHEGRYTGEFRNGCRHGKGIYSWPDGDRYEGYWVKGGRKGKGSLIMKDGRVYDQIWDEPHRTTYSKKQPPKFNSFEQEKDAEIESMASAGKAQVRGI